MIVVRLMGGLGNQMFQYAAGRSLSEQHSTELFLDLSWYEDQKKTQDTKRHYELDIFRLNAQPASPKIQAAINQAVANQKVAKRISGWLYSSSRKLSVLYESSHAYNSAFAQAADNTLLIGYWQSELYFSSIRPALLRELTFKPRLPEEGVKLLKTIRSCESVSLHVRRGDYVTNKAAKEALGALDVNYYKSAVEQIAIKVKGISIFIFSDDPEWCKQNLRFGYETTVVENNQNGREFEDMRLMSACRYNVIANSSFSWWGAWLNQYKDKIVVGPKNWSANQSLDTSSILPESWVVL